MINVRDTGIWVSRAVAWEAASVAEEDRGKVIGRQGRLARALRTIVRASAAGSRKRVILDIVE